MHKKDNDSEPEPCNRPSRVPDRIVTEPATTWDPPCDSTVATSPIPDLPGPARKRAVDAPESTAQFRQWRSVLADHPRSHVATHILERLNERIRAAIERAGTRCVLDVMRAA